MKKMVFLSIILSIILVITFSFLAFASDTNAKNIEFISQYGWKVSENPIEIVKVTLPPKDDPQYINYQAIQKEAGLDLDKFSDKPLTRYTYTVLNYPRKISEPVRLNLLVYDGLQIAGDVMTVSSDGFMHSLIYPQP